MKREAPATWLEDVLTICLEAGQKILQVYNSDFAVTHKADDSPLTQADLAAHRLIAESLPRLAADIPVLSEEAADIPYATRRQWHRYWLVDPLDGTKEFVKRNGEFTVNIALIEDGAPTLGVVHAPALNLSYGAAQGAGAFRIKNGRRDAIRTRNTPPRPALVVSRSHQDAELEKLLAHTPLHDAVSKGSSLKFCLVAAGEADLYPRTGPTSEWDTAAGQCVVEQAGGQVLRLPDFAALRYNEKDSLLNPGFVVLGDRSYGWRQRLQDGA